MGTNLLPCLPVQTVLLEPIDIFIASKVELLWTVYTTEHLLFIFVMSNVRLWGLYIG